MRYFWRLVIHNCWHGWLHAFAPSLLTGALRLGTRMLQLLLSTTFSLTLCSHPRCNLMGWILMMTRHPPQTLKCNVMLNLPACVCNSLCPYQDACILFTMLRATCSVRCPILRTRWGLDFLLLWISSTKKLQGKDLLRLVWIPCLKQGFSSNFSTPSHTQWSSGNLGP